MCVYVCLIDTMPQARIRLLATTASGRGPSGVISWRSTPRGINAIVSVEDLLMRGGCSEYLEAKHKSQLTKHFLQYSNNTNI